MSILLYKQNEGKSHVWPQDCEVSCDHAWWSPVACPPCLLRGAQMAPVTGRAHGHSGPSAPPPSAGPPRPAAASHLDWPHRLSWDSRAQTPALPAPSLFPSVGLGSEKGGL